MKCISCGGKLKYYLGFRECLDCGKTFDMTDINPAPQTKQERDD